EVFGDGIDTLIETVAEGPRRRRRADGEEHLVYAVPDGPLVREAQAFLLEASSDRLGLAVADLLAQHSLRGGKAGPRIAPAARLDAAHWDNDLGVRRHQDGDVDDAVLLGADQLLAVENENGQVAGVLHTKLGYVALCRHFRHSEGTRGKSFLEAHGLDGRQ